MMPAELDPRVLHVVSRRTHKDHSQGIVGWESPTYGQRFDLIVLDREPETAREHAWVDQVLPTRLAPGGRIARPT